MSVERSNNDFSHHVLMASTSMLGLSFLVLTLPNDPLINNPLLIDKLASIAVILFSVSTILSFISLREIISANWFEKVADYIFITGIVVVGVAGANIFIDIFLLT